MTRPELSEAAEFYHGYINRVPKGNILTLLQEEGNAFFNFFESIPAEKHDYAYAEDKWNIKELALHLVDAERVMQYRAMRIARGDKTPLPGFDENLYVPNSFSANRTLDDILAELKIVRESSIALFQSLDASVWSNTGTASSTPISVKALAYIIVGHALHHIEIIKERYL